MLEYFLVGVLIALVAETFVANRTVRPRDDTSPESSSDRLRRIRQRLRTTGV